MYDFQENMTRMLLVTDVQDIIKRHQAQIITSLKDPDIRYFFNLILTKLASSKFVYARLHYFLLHIQITNTFLFG
jgi:hypothetical protein